MFQSRILFHRHLFVGKTLTIVTDVEFQVTFSRYFSACSTRENIFSFFPVATIVTVSTSFERYPSSLSQNPKYAEACKASMEARQNITRGIWVLLSLRKNGFPLNKGHNRNFFHKRAFERLCTSDGHELEITEILDLCDYDCIL